MENKEYEEMIKRQASVNKTPSNTIPMLIIWLVYTAAIIIWRMFFTSEENDGTKFDLQTLVWVAGGATFSYMVGGHVADFIKNKGLPKDIGEIKDIQRYKALTYFWIVLSLISSIAYFKFNVQMLPHTDILIIAGVISCEYIAGNRANKIATILEPPEEECECKKEKKSAES